VKRLVVGVFLVLILAVPTLGQTPATPVIMPLSDVRPGMKGVGRTVVFGQRIEEFGFEVMDVIQAGGGPVGADKLILFRMTGPMVERTGGIAAGMSGSPMYINGKMIGALSAAFAWQLNNREIGLATPIEAMLKILDRRPAPTSEAPVYRASRPHVVGARVVDRVVVASDALHAARLARRAPPDVAVAVPATTAYMWGLTPRAGRLLAELIKPVGHELLQGHGGRGDFAAQPIAPGSSVGVEEVRGDVAFGGICTVTARVGNRLLVCGHPWGNRGDVEYILTASEVLSVIRAFPRPFKISNMGQMVGVIDQDRGAGIAGSVGKYPRLFNVRVIVTDQDSGARVQLGAQMVRRRDLARVFAPLVALSATEQARAQAGGEGTAMVKITLRAKGLSAPIVRENMFFSTSDIATASVLDVVDAMELAFYNDVRALEPFDLTIESVLTRKRITATIVEVEAQSREVPAGGVLRVRVLLQPYRGGDAVVRVIDVPIPRGFPRGPATVVIRSAGVDGQGAPPEALLGQALGSEPQPWGVDNLEDAQRFFQEFGKNTDVVVRVLPFGLPSTPQDFTRFDVPALRTFKTDWVIQGADRIPILIR
jgi:hypothetical protein